MEQTEQLRMREVHLQLPLTEDAVRTLELGDAVFLSGLIFSGREGFYQQVFERGLEPPIDLRHTCNVTFHVECDIQGRSLFSLANAEVNETFQRLYEGLPQPGLKRLGEVTLPTEEVL